VWSLPWCGFDPSPGNFHIPQVQPKQMNKKKHIVVDFSFPFFLHKKKKKKANHSFTRIVDAMALKSSITLILHLMNLRAKHPHPTQGDLQLFVFWVLGQTSSSHLWNLME